MTTFYYWEPHEETGIPTKVSYKGRFVLVYYWSSSLSQLCVKGERIETEWGGGVTRKGEKSSQ